MRVASLSDMHNGWFIGDFTPAILRTAQFEVGYLRHRAGQIWPKHVHRVAMEINCLIRGRMRVCGCELNAGAVFVVEPGEVADPVFLDDCELIVVKVPSVPGDKYAV